jgi:hypothetical protein
MNNEILKNNANTNYDEYIGKHNFKTNSPTSFGVPLYNELWYQVGRATAQAVSHWLPTAAARIRARVWSSGICGGQSGVGAGFLRVLRFPLPIFIQPISPSS